MDEEDGRLGPRGPQFGLADALRDVPTKSLRYPSASAAADSAPSAETEHFQGARVVSGTFLSNLISGLSAGFCPAAAAYLCVNQGERK